MYHLAGKQVGLKNQGAIHILRSTPHPVVNLVSGLRARCTNVVHDLGSAEPRS